MTAIIPPQVSTACSRVMLSSRGTRAVSDFAWALSALVKSDPSLPSRVRMQERGMAMGAGLLGNRPLSKRFRELGIRGFTIRTSPEQEVLVQGLEALFNTALANDLAGVRAVLKDENVFSTERPARRTSEETVPRRTIGEINILMGRMRRANPRWWVYLGRGDIRLVMKLARDSRDDYVPGELTQKRIEVINNRVIEKRINLFREYYCHEEAEGYLLKRVICVIMTGRTTAFGTDKQKAEARTCGFTCSVLQIANPRKKMLAYDVTSSQERDRMALCHIRNEYCTPAGRLKRDVLARVVGLNFVKRDKVAAAIRELENLIAALPERG